MKKTYLHYMIVTLSFVILSIATSFSQVGIGTVTPTNTLHVNGTLRIEGTSGATTATNLMGVDANGVFNNVTAGQNLIQTGNTLASYPTKHQLATITLGSNVTNDLNLNLSGTNKDVVIFQFEYTVANFEITGIAGGTDGRRIILIIPFTNGRDLKLKNKNTNSAVGNRFRSGGDVTIKPGEDFLELIYLNGYWHQVGKY